jgi:anti-sigma regulatory factor (Ser/Thr protein kinase)
VPEWGLFFLKSFSWNPCKTGGGSDGIDPKKKSFMNQQVKLTVPSDPKYLCLIRKVLEHLLVENSVAKETIRRLILCVDEACSNIIKYSYEGECEQPIEISFRVDSENFEARIRDYGKQCDVRSIKPRSLGNVKPGGLGTHFINEIMDEVKYCTEREKGTLLTMCKQLKAS